MLPLTILSKFFSLCSGSRKPILQYKICSVNFSSGMVNTYKTQLYCEERLTIFNERCSHLYFANDEVDKVFKCILK